MEHWILSNSYHRPSLYDLRSFKRKDILNEAGGLAINMMDVFGWFSIGEKGWLINSWLPTKNPPSPVFLGQNQQYPTVLTVHISQTNSRQSEYEQCIFTLTLHANSNGILMIKWGSIRLFSKLFPPVRWAQNIYRRFTTPWFKLLYKLLSTLLSAFMMPSIGILMSPCLRQEFYLVRKHIHLRHDSSRHKPWNMNIKILSVIQYFVCHNNCIIITWSRYHILRDKSDKSFDSNRSTDRNCPLPQSSIFSLSELISRRSS